jgi:hypothetical protein
VQAAGIFSWLDPSATKPYLRGQHSSSPARYLGLPSSFSVFTARYPGADLPTCQEVSPTCQVLSLTHWVLGLICQVIRFTYEVYRLTCQLLRLPIKYSVPWQGRSTVVRFIYQAFRLNYQILFWFLSNTQTLCSYTCTNPRIFNHRTAKPRPTNTRTTNPRMNRTYHNSEYLYVFSAFKNIWSKSPSPTAHIFLPPHICTTCSSEGCTSCNARYTKFSKYLYPQSTHTHTIFLLLLSLTSCGGGIIT